MYLSSLHQQLEGEEEEGRSNHCLPTFRHLHSHQVNQLSVSRKVSQFTSQLFLVGCRVKC